jgi:hypothetical protein
MFTFRLTDENDVFVAEFASLAMAKAMAEYFHCDVTPIFHAIN